MLAAISRRSCIFGLSALLIAPLIAGCGKKKTPSYRIGLGPWIGFGPLYLAKDKGYFKDAGLDVDLIVLTGLAERNSALKAGKIDALAAPVDYFVLAAGNNLVATIAMAIDESLGGDGIVARKDIRTVADLRGKKVAFQWGLPSEFFLRALLLDAGMSLDDLQTLDMETAQAGAAFIAGQIDAAVVWEPWLTKAAQEGGGHVLASTREFPNLIVDVLAFNPNVVREQPGQVQAIVDAILKAIEYHKQHPEEADRIMAPYFQITPQKFAAILEGVRFADLERNRAYFGIPPAKGPIFDVAEKSSKIWLQGDVIKQPIAPDAIITQTFVAEDKQ
jgi:NitT/TauT family transport system substrate-binding protein